MNTQKNFENRLRKNSQQKPGDVNASTKSENHFTIIFIVDNFTASQIKNLFLNSIRLIKN